MVELESSSPEETERIAAKLAERLAVGDVVTVAGELGTGKTTFVRGACRALGVAEPVRSPTFTVGHLYAAPGGPVAHLDLYRSAGLTEEELGDIEPFLSARAVFVEWPEAGGGLLPPPRARVAISAGEGDARLIQLDSGDPELLETLGRTLA
jgi:tRNA threonylcarbamoyladenosine biosynthesis protein TsaE